MPDNNDTVLIRPMRDATCALEPTAYDPTPVSEEIAFAMGIASENGLVFAREVSDEECRGLLRLACAFEVRWTRALVLENPEPAM